MNNVTLIADTEQLAAILESRLSCEGLQVQSYQISAKQLGRNVGDAMVVALERPRPTFEANASTQCWVQKVPYLSTVIMAHEFRIGPVIIPNKTPCLECFERRRRAVTQDQELYDTMHTDDFMWPKGILIPVLETIGIAIAGTMKEVLARQYPLPFGKLGRYQLGDVLSGKLSDHHYAAVGSCTRCRHLHDPGSPTMLVD